MSKVTLDISHSDVARIWHPEKNGNLKPSEFTAGSSPAPPTLIPFDKQGNYCF